MWRAPVYSCWRTGELKRSVILHNQTVISHQVSECSLLLNLLLHLSNKAHSAESNTSRICLATSHRRVGGLWARSGVCTEIRSKPEETLSSACSLVQSLEITQEPYLTHSSKATFTVFLDRLIMLPEEVAGAASARLVLPGLSVWWAILLMVGFASNQSSVWCFCCRKWNYKGQKLRHGETMFIFPQFCVSCSSTLWGRGL